MVSQVQLRRIDEGEQIRRYSVIITCMRFRLQLAIIQLLDPISLIVLVKLVSTRLNLGPSIHLHYYVFAFIGSVPKYLLTRLNLGLQIRNIQYYTTSNYTEQAEGYHVNLRKSCTLSGPSIVPIILRYYRHANY
ncbi:uncharacterized protein F4822DRAFT_213151 [Hypoxylon trugodes]|uniref:uncharacterized protein n=1 Tax=Hypoxylon trugodes TaxID=326681 RepID=UPI00219F7E3A|nr:uncharacterized protein F4822DRAFT_213151 [Hypoxylon trugodes]KAI1389777.1 hypothetical protein F4822DRAFT_213151 [Hypoxylon trugodes]